MVIVWRADIYYWKLAEDFGQLDSAEFDVCDWKLRPRPTTPPWHPFPLNFFSSKVLKTPNFILRVVFYFIKKNKIRRITVVALQQLLNSKCSCIVICIYELVHQTTDILNLHYMNKTSAIWITICISWITKQKTITIIP